MTDCLPSIEPPAHVVEVLAADHDDRSRRRGQRLGGVAAAVRARRYPGGPGVTPAASSRRRRLSRTASGQTIVD
ncbi:MAG: hypothetical protein HYU51_01105 [Candidatus Rokubacteria bacterium]|nr:hypothetical protein [Candidatus Rokubacteria bacterium]